MGRDRSPNWSRTGGTAGGALPRAALALAPPTGHRPHRSTDRPHPGLVGGTNHRGRVIVSASPVLLDLSPGSSLVLDGVEWAVEAFAPVRESNAAAWRRPSNAGQCSVSDQPPGVSPSDHHVAVSAGCGSRTPTRHAGRSSRAPTARLHPPRTAGRRPRARTDPTPALEVFGRWRHGNHQRLAGLTGLRNHQPCLPTLSDTPVNLTDLFARMPIQRRLLRFR